MRRRNRRQRRGPTCGRGEGSESGGGEARITSTSSGETTSTGRKHGRGAAEGENDVDDTTNMTTMRGEDNWQPGFGARRRRRRQGRMGGAGKSSSSGLQVTGYRAADSGRVTGE